ncbi:MAG: hypothetical protein JSV79_12200, partial [Armatimonadota bacterium]
MARQSAPASIFLARTAASAIRSALLLSLVLVVVCLAASPTLGKGGGGQGRTGGRIKTGRPPRGTERRERPRKLRGLPRGDMPSGETGKENPRNGWRLPEPPALAADWLAKSPTRATREFIMIDGGRMKRWSSDDLDSPERKRLRESERFPERRPRQILLDESAFDEIGRLRIREQVLAGATQTWVSVGGSFRLLSLWPLPRGP